MWIQRSMEPVVARAGRERPAVVLTGARQTGKTSLARRLFPDHAFVTLDLPTEAAMAEEEPSRFLERHPPPVVVDEVQYAPGLFRHLKIAIDAARSENGRFILTGSHKLALMRAAAESLAGRAAVLELEGLSFGEIRCAHGDASPEDAAVRGSMPELWERRELHAASYLSSYVATYLERDVRALLNVSSLRDFERFLRACALRSAQLLNKADLARDVGISPSTAAQWLAVLEASNQVALLEPWFANRTRSMVKTPKLYLCDTGLLCQLLGIHSTTDLAASPYAGAVWETFVFGELRRQIKTGARAGKAFFWRDRTKEVDFVVHQAGHFDLLEAKWSEAPAPRDRRSLLAVTAELPPGSVRSARIVCRTAQTMPIGDRVWAVTLDDVAAEC